MTEGKTIVHACEALAQAWPLAHALHATCTCPAGNTVRQVAAKHLPHDGKPWLHIGHIPRAVVTT